MDKLLFNEYVGDKKNIVKSLTREIVSRIVSGEVKYGYKFPSVNAMHKHMNISRSTISKVLQLLSKDKYITLQNGRVAIVTYVYKGNKNKSDAEIIINAQGPVNPLIGYTHEKDKLFHAKQAQFYKDNPLADKTAVYPQLVEKCRSVVNNLQGTNYETDNIYYLNSTRSLYTCICTTLNDGISTFLVPENFIMVQNILEMLKIKQMVLKVDEEGICIDKIAIRCNQRKVKAVFIHSTSGFPFPYATADHRIKALHKLSKIHQFKIIECGGYLPRLAAKPNPILEVFKSNLDPVIYLWKLTRMQEDARNITLVAAPKDQVEKISQTAEYLGYPLDLSSAYATHELLSHKLFETFYQGNNDALSVLMDMVRQIFYNDDFWIQVNDQLENEPVFYLKPRIGRFMRKVFTSPDKSGNVRIKLLDPKYYLKERDPVLGIWIDLSYFIGQKNAYPKLQQFEKILRSMVRWKHVREG
ncbi:GntR family transcriptional regulator [Pedobacter sp. MR2016-24]|uniref:GntR family transcriptional regulator n=1 Tax=Pedobacter sp. MR2016-24 TaxID=2994466 RepID=UPI0022483196|nr:GntR family transcriptional regulator [Pedobacter sp. MR2016-24]MCX2483752.1 GntR family transcriptional regulator [Pedobacter sp. MR2016-24]